MHTKECTPIGVVSNHVNVPVDENWGSIVSRLDIDELYAEGIKGLEAFSHAIVITFLHQAEFNSANHLVRRPRNLDTMPEVGIFAQRGKNRPNPIGITAVKIVNVGKGFVEVKGLDAINGTPILDIKPYYPQYDLITGAEVPEWVNRLMEHYF